MGGYEGDAVWVHNAARCGPGKTGPKTDNRFGHNRKIRETARGITAKGDTVIAGGRKFDGQSRKEAVIPTPDGQKNSRRPDILAERPDKSRYGINVGRTDSHGNKVPREQSAIDDLRNAGLEMIFIAFGRSR